MLKGARGLVVVSMYKEPDIPLPEHWVDQSLRPSYNTIHLLDIFVFISLASSLLFSSLLFLITNRIQHRFYYFLSPFPSRGLSETSFLSSSSTSSSTISHININIMDTFEPVDPQRCAHYAKFASHLWRWQFDLIYWSLFVFNLFVLFTAAYGYTK